MPKLLDVNVWLPLVWNGHVASQSAQQWASTSNEDLVMCRVAELALLRHLTNPNIMGGDVLTNSGASRVIRALRSQQGINFAPDPAGMESLFPSMGETLKADRNRWTDAYFAAFAIAGNHQLITFDRGSTAYEKQGLRWQLLTA